MKKTQETQVQSLVREDPMDKKMATYSSIFAGIILWTEEHGGQQSMGLQRSQTQLSNSTETFIKTAVSKQPVSETTTTENLDQSPLLPEPAWAAIIPSPGWLRQQIFISYSARGWKSGLLDQGASMVEFLVREPSWLCPQMTFSWCLHRERKNPSLFLFLKGH